MNVGLVRSYRLTQAHMCLPLRPPPRRARHDRLSPGAFLREASVNAQTCPTNVDILTVPPLGFEPRFHGVKAQSDAVTLKRRIVKLDIQLLAS